MPIGSISRSIEVYIQEDIVDLTKPGDVVQIIGILKPVKIQAVESRGIFRKVFLAYSLEVL